MATDAKNLKVCRVPEASQDAFAATVPATGSLYWLEGKKRLAVGDGTTAGGVEIGGAVETVNGASPDASGNIAVGTVTSVNGVSPDADGNVAVGTVKSVSGVSPDSAGNVALDSRYLRLSGGTMTGSISSTLDGGPQVQQTDGANRGGMLYLFGSQNATWKGGFILRAFQSDNSTYKDLMGKSDGTLKWAGNAVHSGDSGAGAGSVGPSANASGTAGSSSAFSFNVPWIQVNAQGHVTSKATRTISIKCSASCSNCSNCSNCSDSSDMP